MDDISSINIITKDGEYVIHVIHRVSFYENISNGSYVVFIM